MFAMLVSAYFGRIFIGVCVTAFVLREVLH